MKSRYGIWILSVCWIGLAGCSNWQNRINSTSGPGSAASLSAAPAVNSSPLLQGPDPSFGEPPPPVPPPLSDPGMNLEPLGGAPPQRLDLSAAGSAPAPAPQKMYNLESSGSSGSKKTASSKPAKSAAGSSTISRLASKSKTTENSSAAKPKGSALERLSAQAPKPKAEAKAEVAEEPAKKESVAPAQVDPEPAVDTTFLAQPVRKGSADDNSSGKNGPQSNAIPNENKLFNGRNKPVIYPVSNPAAEEPVDITQFS